MQLGEVAVDGICPEAQTKHLLVSSPLRVATSFEETRGGLASRLETPDVLVIGGGAIGVAAAHELASEGMSVTLLERGDALASGCSYGNTGLIRTSHAKPLANPTAIREALRWSLSKSSPFYVRSRLRVLPWLLRFAAASRSTHVLAATETTRQLSTIGRRLHAEYAHSGIDTGSRGNGVLDVYATEQGLQKGTTEAKCHAAAGERNQTLQPHELRQAAPTLGQAVVGGMYYPDDANCDPLRFVQSVGASAQRRGIAICTRANVLGFECRGARIGVARTSQGHFHAGIVVLAAGVWSRGLAQQIGIFLPIEGAKGYHVDLQPSAGDPRLPISIREARVIATPLTAGLRFGGTLELDGLDLRINTARVEAIKRVAYRPFEHARGIPVANVWSGLRPCTPDGLPMIGWASAADNVIVATGHGMSGLQLAPLTRRLVAELVLRRPLSCDLLPLRPDRFAPFLAGIRSALRRTPPRNGWSR